MIHPSLEGAEVGRAPLWRRLTTCWMGFCGFRTASDETGIWGQCQTCGKRAGYVSREALRAYADREVEAALLKASESNHE